MQAEDMGTVDVSYAQYIKRDEKDMVDRIVQGSETGHYFMLIGPKVSNSRRGDSDACALN